VTHADEVQNVLQTFLEYRTIVFVGCGSGLEDPNFGALLKWASERHGNIPNRHCLLVRDGDDLNHEMLVRLKYGPNYSDLASYLQCLLDEPLEPPPQDSNQSQTGKQAKHPCAVSQVKRESKPSCVESIHFAMERKWLTVFLVTLGPSTFTREEKGINPMCHYLMHWSNLSRMPAEPVFSGT
jgi:hypothetical protein